MVYHHKKSIESSLGESAPDIILKGGSIVNVHSNTVEEGDIAIKHHRIVGMYDEYTSDENTMVLDVKGKYIMPGFIDPHIHIESSMLGPLNFGKVVIPRGTTTVVADPHEVANVLGIKGVKQMMTEAEFSDLRTYFTVSSCVPALGAPFETSGATLNLDDVKALLSENSSIGLGEVMNFPGVIHKDLKVLAKIHEAYRTHGSQKTPSIVDGHCPFLAGKELSAYINAGIQADHECSTGKELEERLKKGMYVMVRNGSSAKNAEALFEHVYSNGLDTRRILLCSDDKNPYDLLNVGHMDKTLKLVYDIAKSHGKDNLAEVVRMATLNSAEFLKKPYLGRIGIQARADIAILDKEFNVYATLINGKLVAKEGKLIEEPKPFTYQNFMLNTVHINKVFKGNDFRVNALSEDPTVRIIKINEGDLFTNELSDRMNNEYGEIKSDTSKDYLKMGVVHRHMGDDNYSIGFVNGFGIKHGAVASTIGHDSHNLGVIGTNDDDMAYAIEELKRIQGGVVVVKDGKTLASLELKIAGLMSTESPENVVADKIKLYDAYKNDLGGSLKDPVVAMSFLQLPVIPELKLTDKGYVALTDKGPEKRDIFVF